MRVLNVASVEQIRRKRSARLKGRNSLQYRGPVIWNFLKRLVKVPENYNSYKQMLKKHTRDIAGYSFSKEATLITAKKDDFIYF